MRNTSFFEKLTGSLRLSDDDLKALNESDDNSAHATTNVAPAVQPSSPVTSSTTQDGDTIIEEVEDDFEVPEDAEVETVEEVIEDDSIDSEQVEEYYEEIIDQEEAPTVIRPTIEHSELPVAQVHEDTIKEDEQEELAEDYPIFNLEAEEEPDEEEDIIDFNPPTGKKALRVVRPLLPIDMYELHHEIIIRTLVPGITPEHLKVSITRDHVSISGTRPAPDGIPNDNYFEREVEWGEFSRMIELPTEVDVEHAEAVEKYGLLVIRLPKVDSMKTQELKVKSV